MARRSLVDTVQDPNAKEAFIKEGSKKPVTRPKVETRMLNTRVPEDLIRRVKVYCAQNSSPTFIHCTITGNTTQGGCKWLASPYENGRGQMKRAPFGAHNYSVITR